MTRINRPDTLLTSLREVQRRLRLLEATRTATVVPNATTTGTSKPDAFPAGSVPVLAVPFVPARPADWPATDSAQWEPLIVTTASRRLRGARLRIRAIADTTAYGSVRITLDGFEADNELSVPPEPTHHEVALPDTGDGEVEIVIEARRISGTGMIRAMALLLLAG